MLDAVSGATPAADQSDVSTLLVPNGQTGSASPFASLAYNINIQLPESRDPAVYNAIFKALREHFR